MNGAEVDRYAEMSVSKISKFEVTGRQKTLKNGACLAHVSAWHGPAGSGASGSPCADCKLRLSTVGSNSLSEPETLGKWTDSRILRVGTRRFACYSEGLHYQQYRGLPTEHYAYETDVKRRARAYNNIGTCLTNRLRIGTRTARMCQRIYSKPIYNHPRSTAAPYKTANTLKSGQA